MPRPPEYDCIIVGGGLVGACLALALSRLELRLALIERRAAPVQQRPSFDDRALALNLVSQGILNDLNLWSSLSPQAAPIRRVHVSERGRFGVVRIDADQYGLDALGHVVTARIIGTFLTRSCAQLRHLTTLQPAELQAIRFGPDRVALDIVADQRRMTLDTRLLVGADGTDSTVRELLGLPVEVHDYRQTAVLTNIIATRAPAGTAFERFTPAGPVAVLPMHDDRSKCVWVERADRSDELLHIDDAEFERRLDEIMGGRLGRLRATGRRQAYPLRAQWVRRGAGQRYVLVGNSATTLHPNGAQSAMLPFWPT
jgi:2-octaprenyl-6-methoxyphenol hydroxylase